MGGCGVTLIGGRLKNWIIAIVVVAIGTVVAIGWLRRERAELPAGIASGNGRIEAVEYDIATKRPGRIAKVLAREGDMVEPGQVLAEMDIRDLQAELRQAEAELHGAMEGRRQAVAVVAQKQSDIKQVLAAIAQRESELKWADREFERSQELLKKDLISRQQFDSDQTKKLTAEAALAMEQARKQTADAALKASEFQVNQGDAAIEAAKAAIERIKTDIDDSRIQSAIQGRVLYRLAEPGEVLAAGGKVLTVLDLSDVYMTIFLPTSLVGRLNIGAEGRIVLDAAPDLVIPAMVSFVAPRSQFTPREVETKTEREKLMFRVKVKIDPALLKKNIEKVKTGLPGVAYVLLNTNATWPEHLQVKLPP
jgi:HlyD family secretion protein